MQDECCGKLLSASTNGGDAARYECGAIRYRSLTWASAEFTHVKYRPIMRYFFDTRDNGTFIEDDIGTEFADQRNLIIAQRLAIPCRLSIVCMDERFSRDACGFLS